MMTNKTATLDPGHTAHYYAHQIVQEDLYWIADRLRMLYDTAPDRELPGIRAALDTLADACEELGYDGFERKMT
jgi:hypothetical protein